MLTPAIRALGQVPLRLDQLLGHEVGLLPPAEREEDRDQRGADRQDQFALGQRCERPGRRRRWRER